MSAFDIERESMRISVVGTVHADCGLANVVELQAILTRLEPDVIFAEIPPPYLDRYVDGSHGTIESIAVRHYRESHQVPVVPVDLAKPEDEFFRHAENLFGIIERTSPDYRRMVDQHSLETRLGGFPYLNSSRCMQAWANICGEVLATVDWIREPWVREVYDLWTQTEERRDKEMMRNIEDYCVRHLFAHGVFLVGAAHRKAIVNTAQGLGRTGSPKIEWQLTGLLDGPCNVCANNAADDAANLRAGGI